MSGHNYIVEDLKTRLDKYLAEQLKGISRSQIQRDIEVGSVLVNGKVIKESKFVVRVKDKIVYNQQKEKSTIFAPAKIVLFFFCWS